MDVSYYSPSELKALGLGLVGKDVRISRKTSFYNPQKIRVGHYARIDDFCILSGNIFIGQHVHIAPFCGLFASAKGIRIRDFVSLSSRVAIYGMTDDYD